MNLQELKKEIEGILDRELPNFSKGVKEYNGFGTNNDHLKIWFACSSTNINNVEGQKVQICSFMLTTKFELNPQIFGGCGGRSIYRLPNREIDSEKYLAMKSIILPFRTPKKEFSNVSQALIKFCRTYKQALKDNIENLCYQNLVNYKELLK